MKFVNLEIVLTDSSESHEIIFLPKDEDKYVLDKKISAKIASNISYFELNVWDQKIYRVLDFDIVDGILKAKFSLDTFYNYRFGIGGLWNELMQGLIDNDFNIKSLVNNYNANFSIRKRYLPDRCV